MRKLLYLFWKVSRINIKAAPGLVLWSGVNLLARVARLLLNIYLPLLIINAVTAGKLQSMLWYLLAIVLSNAVLAKVPGLLNSRIKFSLRELVIKHEALLNEKCLRLSIAQLEDPKIHALHESAKYMLLIQASAVTALDISTKFFEALVMVVAVSLLSVGLSPLLLGIFLLFALLQLVVVALGSARMAKFTKKVQPINMAYAQLVHTIIVPEQNMDVRLYRAEDLILDRIEERNRKMTSFIADVYKSLGITSGLLGVLNVLAVAAAYLWVGLRSLTTRFGPMLGLGSFAFYLSAFTQLNSQLTVLTNTLGQLIQMLTMCEPACRFLDLPEEAEQPGDMPLPEHFDEWECRDVWFRYPGTEKDVLRGVSFKIRSGEKISLVGLNGSGKTTLVKLFCRFYNSDRGEILLNGVDLRRYSATELRRHLSAIFQDYHLFSLSLGENVACDRDYDEARIMKTLERFGLGERVQQLPDGLNTSFGALAKSGLKLSGGESQKVAIARALYRDSQFILLDEPTSALDPKSEAEIYEHFSQLVEDKMAIYISHRMSSSVFCDRIIVLNDGQVQEAGSHADLMAAQGLYHKLFTTQQAHYRREAERTEAFG